MCRIVPLWCDLFIYSCVCVTDAFEHHIRAHVCGRVRVCIRESECKCVCVCVPAHECTCALVSAPKCASTFIGVDHVWLGSQAFREAPAFNTNIGAWNTAAVTTLYAVCTNFGQRRTTRRTRSVGVRCAAAVHAARNMRISTYTRVCVGRHATSHASDWACIQPRFSMRACVRTYHRVGIPTRVPIPPRTHRGTRELSSLSIQRWMRRCGT